MDYKEMYDTYVEIDEFVYCEYGYGKPYDIDQWCIEDDNLKLQISYETDCDAGCGYHYSEVCVPLTEFSKLFTEYRNKKSQLVTAG